jgi:HEAT repeat protein
MEGGNKPVDAFIAALSDSNAEVREAAVEAISETQDKRAVRPLIKLLSDPSADVRHQTAHALGNLQDPTAADPLAAALRDSDSDVRGAAAQSLAELGLQAPSRADCSHQDKNADVRQNAVQALGQIRDPKSVPDAPPRAQRLERRRAGRGHRRPERGSRFVGTRRAGCRAQVERSECSPSGGRGVGTEVGG